MNRISLASLATLAASALGACSEDLPPPCLAETVTGGYSGTIVGKADGTYCVWGYGAADLVAPNSVVSRERLTPRRMDWLTEDTAGVTLRNDGPCVLSSQRQLRCAGLYSVPTTMPIDDVARVAMGVTNSAGGGGINCAVRTDGTVGCFGTTDEPIEEQTGIGNDVVWAAIGTGQRCAIKSDGSLWCWGYGFLGDGQDEYPENNTQPPRSVSLSLPAVAVETGFSYNCAVLQDRSVWCWGDRGFGSADRQGLPPFLAPVKIDIADVKVLAMGAFHACALKNDGSVWCWGQNHFGQTGYGPGGYTGSDSWETPRWVVDVGNDVTLIATGNSHTCARKADATIWCWGNSTWGQVENDLVVNPSPVQMLGCQ